MYLNITNYLAPLYAHKQLSTGTSLKSFSLLLKTCISKRKQFLTFIFVPNIQLVFFLIFMSEFVVVSIKKKLCPFSFENQTISNWFVVAIERHYWRENVVWMSSGVFSIITRQNLWKWTNEKVAVITLLDSLFQRSAIFTVCLYLVNM